MSIEGTPEDGWHLADNDLLRVAASLPRSDEILLQHAAKVARLGYFIFELDRDAVTVCSERHAEIFGLTPDEFIAHATGVEGGMTLVHPDDVATILAAYERLRAGKDVEMAYRFRRFDGSEGWIREFVVPQRDERGRVVQGLGSSLDITGPRLAAERAKEAHRLEALGGLTAGVAHDFNNLLSVIMGNAELVSGMTTQADALACLEDIVSAAKRGARLTNSLLSFAQRSRMQPVALELGAELQGCVRSFRRLSRDEFPLTLEPWPEALPVRLDPDGLQQCLLNLLINARDASEPGDEIVVQSFLDPAPGPGQAARAGVRIIDRGCGIPADILSRICEPFFTTKGRAQGSGLGLSMAQGFVAQSGGAMTIRSAPGAGTTVTITFPVDTGISERSQPPEPDPAGDLAGMRVLLLEDEEQVAKIMIRLLHAAGALVTWARDGAEARRLIHAHHLWDAAVLDRIVPGALSGIDIARLLRAKRPGLPVVLVSGLPETGAADEMLVDRILAKPVNGDLLVRTLSTLLHSVRA